MLEGFSVAVAGGIRIAFIPFMDTFSVIQTPSRLVLASSVLLSLFAGFGAGWLARRPIASSRPAPIAAPQPPACPAAAPLLPTAQPDPDPSWICTHELAEDEEDCPGATRIVVREAPYQYRLNRRVFSCLLSAKRRPHRLATMSRSSFSVIDGKPTGIKLYGLRPDDLLARLGFRIGDRVHTINGMSIATPDLALQAYSRLRSAEQVTVGVERRAADGKLAEIQLRYRVVSDPDPRE